MDSGITLSRSVYLERRHGEKGYLSEPNSQHTADLEMAQTISICYSILSIAAILD